MTQPPPPKANTLLKNKVFDEDDHDEGSVFELISTCFRVIYHKTIAKTHIKLITKIQKARPHWPLIFTNGKFVFRLTRIFNLCEFVNCF